jgi:hypothetical protein
MQVNYSLLSLLIFAAIALGDLDIVAPGSESSAALSHPSVSIFHEVDGSWFNYVQSGQVDCNAKCNYLRNNAIYNNPDVRQVFKTAQTSGDITVVIFTRDSWGQDYYPSCSLNATLTFMGSWEPAFRTKLDRFAHYDFDGNISTLADSTVRKYCY